MYVCRNRLYDNEAVNHFVRGEASELDITNLTAKRSKLFDIIGFQSKFIGSDLAVL
jgi:hypothetical protein